MRTLNENGRAALARPTIQSPDGAPGTALNVGMYSSTITITDDSDAQDDVVRAYPGVNAGVALLHLGVRDAHDCHLSAL